MHNHPKVIRLVTVVVVILILIGGYYVFNKKPVSDSNTPVATSTPTPSPLPVPLGISYVNAEYSFSISLPETWEGYMVIEDEWEGFEVNSTFEKPAPITGPLISIRHPDWEYKSPRQDIPIMVFTLAQWNDMKADKFHIGAAPINPSEIGRNSKYVFAIPARYNFAYLTGYEEVEQILTGDNFKAF